MLIYWAGYQLPCLLQNMHLMIIISLQNFGIVAEYPMGQKEKLYQIL